MKKQWTLPVAALAAIAGIVAAPVAHADTTPVNYPNVMMVGNHGATLAANGVNATYGYVLGDSVGDSQKLSYSQLAPLKPGQIPHLFNYYALKWWLTHGKRGIFMLDLEGSGKGRPGYSPVYQVDTPAHMEKYDHMAIDLVKHYPGARLVVASVFSSALAYHEAVLDAKWGAWAVDLQDQWATNKPWEYSAVAHKYLSAFTAAGVRRPVLCDNLSSNPGGMPVTAANMILSYEKTWRIFPIFWVEDPVWVIRSNGQPAPGCASEGCPLITKEFLAKISPR